MHNLKVALARHGHERRVSRRFCKSLSLLPWKQGLRTSPACASLFAPACKNAHAISTCPLSRQWSLHGSADLCEHSLPNSKGTISRWPWRDTVSTVSPRRFCKSLSLLPWKLGSHNSFRDPITPGFWVDLHFKSLQGPCNKLSIPLNFYRRPTLCYRDVHTHTDTHTHNYTHSRTHTFIYAPVPAHAGWRVPARVHPPVA